MIHSRPVCLTGRLACAAALVTFAVSMPAGAQDQPPMPGPTAEHELLKDDVGTWDARLTLWHEPGAEPMTSQCTEKNELLPGGLWAVSRFDGELMGMKFSGVGTYGYDPIEKKYVGVWVDNMSPHMMISKADYDPATKTMTGIAEGRNPETGKVVVYKQFVRYVDEDTRTFEMHMPGEDGEYWKLLEIQYKRRSE